MTAPGKIKKNPTFQYELGMTQWKLGHTAEARTLLVKALELDAHFPEGFLRSNDASPNLPTSSLTGRATAG